MSIINMPNITTTAIMGIQEDWYKYWMKLIGPRVTLCDPYWLQYPPPGQIINIALGIFVAIIGLFSIFGNVLVCYAFIRSPSQRRSRMFHVNLSLSDGLSCLLTYHMFTVSSFQGIWAFSVGACQYYALVQGYFGLMSIVSLAAIALERFAAIAAHDSIWCDMSYSLKLKIIVFIWAYCFIVVCPPLFGLGKYVAAGFMTTCCFDYIDRGWKTKVFILQLFGLGLIVPMAAIIYSYYRIYKAAKISHEQQELRRADEEQETLQLGQGNDDTRISPMPPIPEAVRVRIKSKDMRVAGLMLKVIILFVIAWTPYAIVALLGQFGPEGSVSPWMAMVPSVFAKSSTVYNPLLYGVKDSRFKRAFMKYIVRDQRALREGTESVTTKMQSEIPEHHK